MLKKICVRCGKKKPFTAFNKEKTRRDGHAPWCRKCRKIYQKERYATITEKERQRRSEEGRIWRMKNIFGITLIEYDEMLEIQGGGCAICGKTPEENGKRLAVDHCHEINENRGLLCMCCNDGLGRFKDNPRILRKAASYLEGRT